MVAKSEFIIDDFKIKGFWVKSVKVEGKRYTTLAASKWWEMLKRCDEGGNFQMRHPTYKGCYCSEEFKDFQYFAEWCQSQIGYGQDEYHLDKDILIENNKLYSQDTCVFVPPEINTFFNSCTAARGKYVQGVSHLSKGHGLRAQIQMGGKVVGLGIFDNEEDAYNAYKDAKEKEARERYNHLLNNNFVIDPRVLDVLRHWKLPNYADMKQQDILTKGENASTKYEKKGK